MMKDHTTSPKKTKNSPSKHHFFTGVYLPILTPLMLFLSLTFCHCSAFVEKKPESAQNEQNAELIKHTEHIHSEQLNSDASTKEYKHEHTKDQSTHNEQDNTEQTHQNDGFPDNTQISDDEYITDKQLPETNRETTPDSQNKNMWAAFAISSGAVGFEAKSMAMDSNGDIVVTGYYRTQATFGSHVLKSPDYLEEEIFIAKLSKHGKWLWAKTAKGSFSYERGTSIAVDSKDNIIVTGYFYLTTTFGTTKLTAKGSSDIFLAKLDKNGGWLWAKQIGSETTSSDTPGNPIERGFNVKTTISNDIIFLARTFGPCQIGQLTLSEKRWYIVLSKLDKNGVWKWAKNLEINTPPAIAIDRNGNIAIASGFSRELTLGQFKLKNTTSSTPSRFFVAKLDTNGNWLWVTDIQAQKVGGYMDITFDQKGNIYTVSNFRNDLTIGTTKLTSPSLWSLLFIAKLDASGNWLWAKQSTDPAQPADGYVSKLIADKNNDLLILGTFRKKIHLGNDIFVINGSRQEAFISKMSSAGVWKFASHIGPKNTTSSIDTFAYDITLDPQQNVYLLGNFLNPTEVNGHTFTSTQTGRFILLKIGQLP